MIPWLSVVSLCTLLAVPDVVAAVECDPQDARLCAQALSKGQLAPFDGQLLTVPLSLKLGQKADRCDQVTAMEVDFAKKLADVDLQLEKQLHAEDDAAHAREMKAMQGEVDRWKVAADIPFWERPWFVALLTTAVIGGITMSAANLSK